MADNRVRAVLDAEQQRCDAIAAGNLKALAALLSDDYVHVHGTGRVGDKDDYIKGIEFAPRVPVRANLQVRLHDDTALLIGDLLNTIEYPGRGTIVIETTASALLRERNGRWIFLYMQLTPRHDL
jgi:ketosteroid isomerase-like protein